MKTLKRMLVCFALLTFIGCVQRESNDAKNTLERSGIVSKNLSGGIALTFDDNAVEEWHRIRPQLDELGIRATFFISSYHKLTPERRELVWELANDGHQIAAHSSAHANAARYCPEEEGHCTSSDEERANRYIDEQILPQLEVMAKHGLHPRDFAYPYGADLPATTQRLLAIFGFVRDTSYFPHHQAAYAGCGQGRFVGGLGIDTKYGISEAHYDAAMDRAAERGETLVFYGHRIDPRPDGYFVGEERLRDLIVRAQARGLLFRRMRDLCSWQAATETGGWRNVHDSPRELSQVVFADFTGDGLADAFRANGRRWEVLPGQGNSFYASAGDEHWQRHNTSSIGLDNLRFGDFDGDGRTDVFRTSGGTWFVSFGGTGPWTRMGGSDEALDNLRLADFNGDRATDVFTSVDGWWYVFFGAREPWVKLQRSRIALDRLRFGDFDGDGRTDVWAAFGGKWKVSYSGTTRWQTLAEAHVPAEELAFVDLDGDRRTDIFHATGTAWYVAYGGDGDWRWLRDASETSSELAFADLDGDGAAEILRMARPVGEPVGR